MSVYPDLDAKRMLRPILRNYNRHALRFVRLLESLSCEAFYEGPRDLRDHVRDKSVYACSIRVRPTDAAPGEAVAEGSRRAPSKRKSRVLKNVFPVMIGSDLDHCVRKRGLETLSEGDLTEGSAFLDEVDGRADTFCPADIAASFFLINGCVRQLPYFFTNDPTNAHVVRGRSLVRCYTYDADDRGKEMSYFAERDAKGRYERGEVRVVLNDGTAIRNGERLFFDRCPHRTRQAAYMDRVYRDGRFDIDHLANKVVVSPGHLFTKLFVKYLYRPLKTRDWPAVKSKHALVVRSIESGTLLHVLSKKTVYFRDPPSTMTVVNPAGSSRGGATSFSAGGGDVYVEKNSGCYREVSMQTYPLNPYLSYLITRQMSNKVSNANTVAFHPSYAGFLCVVGTFETKHIGRTGVMVRETAVSVRDDVDRVYRFLRLEEAEEETKSEGRGEGETNDGGPSSRRGVAEPFYAVVNEACVPVTAACFERVCASLERLKAEFRLVECRRDENFVSIRYKTGLFFKKLFRLSRDGGGRRPKDEVVWVTPRDAGYWKRRLGDRLRPEGFDRVTSYLRDLNPFFNHNVFTKNILAYNTLKSGVLSTDPRYSEYFMETLSAYAPVTPRHRVVCRPVDAFSARFALRVPLLAVAYASFKGLNQEDCVVVRRDVEAFDCYRFHTVRLKFDTPSRLVSFHPTTGDPDAECRLLGNLVCHDASLPEFRVAPQTMHARLEPVDGGVEGRGCHHYRVYFNKSGFAIRSHVLTESRLVVCLERFHPSRTGDKLSSFHGQKGVVRRVDSMPVFGRFRDARGNVSTVAVDMLVNPYCLFRMTPGQIREALFRGGRDYDLLWNSDGVRVAPSGPFGIFVGLTFYVSVNYFADEHIHTPLFCSIDKITAQPLRGRSRNGGMRMGNMEILNGMRGNGLSATYEEKALEHSDRMFHPVATPGRKRKRESREPRDALPPAKRLQRASKRVARPPVRGTVKRGGRAGLRGPLTKSTFLTRQDVLFYKVNIEVHMKPYFEEVKENDDCKTVRNS